MQTGVKETIQERLIREEQEDAKQPVYSPKMSPAEIEAFIARLHEHAEEWAKEQTELTDSVPIIREMRAARTEQLMRRVHNARRD